MKNFKVTFFGSHTVYIGVVLEKSSCAEVKVSSINLKFCIRCVYVILAKKNIAENTNISEFIRTILCNHTFTKKLLKTSKKHTIRFATNSS